ncbi:MAG: iron chelate uptake ABC transporter family permease subunit, partial [Lachnospiraceae bacterium]|nr:iron chelate uptake ABC transporter family permease subunit [Lachnospiraceae bacterium]
MEKAGTKKRTIIGFGIMLVLLGTAAFISVAAGSVSVNIFAPLSDNDSMIIFDIRLPRTLLAAVSGAALAVS